MSNMSVNNLQPQSRLIPQFATNPLTGQIFVIAPDQLHHGISYLLPRTSLPGVGQQLNSQSSQLYQTQQAPQSGSSPNPALPIQISQPKPAQATQTATTSSYSSPPANIQISRAQLPQSTQPTPLSASPSPAIKSETSGSHYDSKNISKTVMDKCVSHYIEGQLIIESSTPLHELNLKTSKRKEKKRRIHPLLKKARTEETVPSIRAEMSGWSVSDVVRFIERHEDIKEYSSKFADDEVDGKALLLMIDRNLNLQTLASMFKHGPAMKIEAVLSKYKIEPS